MIDVPLSKIDLATIDALISNGVTESQTLDFKADLSLTTPDDKKEFLKDVSAFANAAGGDLVLGVTQDKATGAANGRPGIAIPKFDSWMQTLENLLHSSIDPRLPAVAFHPIPLGGDLFVVVLRIRQSWYGPHRVELGRSKFYGRHSAGVFEMNVAQLRNAFTLSDTLIKRMQDFRDERLARVLSNTGPIPLIDGPKLMVLICPVASLGGRVHLDLASFRNETSLLLTLDGFGANFTHALEGAVNFRSEAQGTRSAAYTLTFRNGAIEFVAAVAPRAAPKAFERTLSLNRIESAVITAFDRFNAFYEAVDISPPSFVFLSLADAAGYTVYVDPMQGEQPLPLRRSDVVLPELEIADASFEYRRALKPTFDILWNAFGLAGSQSFGPDGWQKS